MITAFLCVELKCSGRILVLSSHYNLSEMSCKMAPICYPCSKLMRSTVGVWVQVLWNCLRWDAFRFNFHSRLTFLGTQSTAQNESVLLFSALSNISLWAHLGRIKGQLRNLVGPPLPMTFKSQVLMRDEFSPKDKCVRGWVWPRFL